jgi:hypothetical protein
MSGSVQPHGYPGVILRLSLREALAKIREHERAKRL